MKDIWTNTTWANWLESNNVPKGMYALLEMNGNGLPIKVIAREKVSENLYPKIPKNKRWHIAWWDNYGTTPCVGSSYPSTEYLEKNKIKHKG